MRRRHGKIARNALTLKGLEISKFKMLAPEPGRRRYFSVGLFPDSYILVGNAFFIPRPEKLSGLYDA